MEAIIFSAYMQWRGHFGARDFFKINGKIIWGAVVANVQGGRELGQKISIDAPHFYSSGHTPAWTRQKCDRLCPVNALQ